MQHPVRRNSGRASMAPGLTERTCPPVRGHPPAFGDTRSCIRRAAGSELCPLREHAACSLAVSTRPVGRFPGAALAGIGRSASRHPGIGRSASRQLGREAREPHCRRPPGRRLSTRQRPSGPSEAAGQPLLAPAVLETPV